MGSYRRRARSRGEEATFVGRACQHCGSATVITPCRVCGAWFVVCDCDDLRVAVDGFLNTDGRCSDCRPWLHEDAEEDGPRPRLRRSKRRRA